jgi:hypothetical protein
MGKSRQKFGKEAQRTRRGGQALQNEMISVKDLTTQFSRPLVFRVMLFQEIGSARVSNESSLANKETLCTYLAAKIGSASGKYKATIVGSMIRLLEQST